MLLAVVMGLFLFTFILFKMQRLKDSKNLTITEKSRDGVLGTQTWGGWMEGTDKFTELWQPKLLLRKFHNHTT